MNRSLITHFDLDGVGCDILLNQILGFEHRYHGGYNTVKKHFNSKKLSGYDSCFVTDLAIDQDMFDGLYKEYGDKLLFIDHHPSSKAIVQDVKSPHILYSPNYSATGIIYRHFKSKLEDIQHIKPFVDAVDGYDMWRIDGDDVDRANFSMGYKLNILFWFYGYNTFFARFNANMSLEFSEYETKIINDHKIERNTALHKSDRNDFGKNSLCVINAPHKFINDYTIFYPKYDVYYIIYTSFDGGEIRMSVRNKLVSVDIGDIVKKQIHLFENVSGAGGHKSAGGVDFGEGVTMDDIFDVIESINTEVENYYE